MSDANRKDVLKAFARHQAYMDDRIKSGIETNRKGFMSLNFQDKDGKPLSGVKVKVKQKTHDFKFGANLFMLEEFDSKEQNDMYKKYYADLFNIATLPFYWVDLEPEQGKPRFAKDSPKIYRRPAPDLCLEYCEANNIMPKAHCLNYAYFTPEWACGTIDKEKRLLSKRFRELAERYADRIRDWEVTNETFWGHRHPSIKANMYYQDDFVEWSFDQADRFFPANRLIINEAHSRVWESVAGYYGNRSPYYAQIERALLKGLRIDAIGMQYHMFYRREDEQRETAVYYDPQRIYDILDTYGKLKRNIQITELTIPAYSYTAGDEEIQAEIMRNIYSMWFSHESMEAILYWNLVDGFAAFAPQGDMTAGENYYHGGLIRYDFTKKPVYDMLYNLIHKEWHTETESESNEYGVAPFKGFYGEYDLEITFADGTVKNTSIHLNKELSKFVYFQTQADGSLKTWRE